jgi:hypothetical protein
VFLTLAAEAAPNGLWYPTIIGVLAVVAGISLFCGSIYLLLGTNLGARLGFLVAFTSLAGFMVLLTTLWMTTASPLNTLKGRIPQWKVVEVVSTPSKASVADVHNIQKKQFVASTTDASNVKAAVDAALVTKVQTPTLKVTPNDNRFAKFEDVTKYTILQTYLVGGSKPQFWKFQLHHTPKYALVQFCEVKDTTSTRPFGLPPLPPECSTAKGAKKGFVVLRFDLGSVRVPPFVAFLASLILFGLGLLCLHWREKDEMAAEAAKAGPVAVPDRDESELAKV